MAIKESIARKLVSAITRGKAPAKKQAKARADQATPLLKARRAGKEATLVGTATVAVVTELPSWPLSPQPQQ